MIRSCFLSLLVSLLSPAALAASAPAPAPAPATKAAELAERWSMPHPPRAERLAKCKADKQFRCEAKTKFVGAKRLPANVYYGWNVGKGHPFSDSKPPPYDRLLNGLDQCAWFHDRGAWRWNPRTKVCEGLFMCSNTIGLWKCASAYKPETKDEQEAKDGMMRSIGRIGELCIRKLYKDYGVQFARDRHGSLWLSEKATGELADAFVKCKPKMAIPGFAKLAKMLAARLGEENVNALNRAAQAVKKAATKAAAAVKGAAKKVGSALKSAGKKLKALFSKKKKKDTKAAPEQKK